MFPKEEISQMCPELGTSIVFPKQEMLQKSPNMEAMKMLPEQESSSLTAKVFPV